MIYNGHDNGMFINEINSIPYNMFQYVPLSSGIMDNDSIYQKEPKFSYSSKFEDDSNKEGETNMMDSMFNNSNLFGKIAPGMCRLSMNGNIAVKTSNGYKSYNVKTGRLVNCNQFVFNIGEEFFFVIPTNKVQKGDIILVNNKPRCVIKNDKETITVINYEDSTVDTILPERHVFMGNTYFYGKIVSMFGNMSGSGKNGLNKMMKFMMMSEMMKSMNGNQSSNSGMSSLLPFMLMGGNMENMFDGVFDFSDNDETDEIDEADDEEPVNLISKGEEIGVNGLCTIKNA